MLLGTSVGKCADDSEGLSAASRSFMWRHMSLIRVLPRARFSWRRAMRSIGFPPDSLRANVTWLAADQRQGRMTPSPGLEASADYLAAHFQQSGLAPGGQNGTYFQTAEFAQVTPQLNDFRMTLEGRHTSMRVWSAGRHSAFARRYRLPAMNRVVRLPQQIGTLPDITGRVVPA